jgi:hypothetical protein
MNVVGSVPSVEGLSARMTVRAPAGVILRMPFPLPMVPRRPPKNRRCRVADVDVDVEVEDAADDAAGVILKMTPESLGPPSRPVPQKAVGAANHRRERGPPSLLPKSDWKACTCRLWWRSP